MLISFAVGRRWWAMFRPEIDPRWEASPEAVGRADQAAALGIEGPQHCVGDGGGTVAATEFARGEARGKGAVDRAFDRARGGSGTVMAVAFGQPVEHQRGGEDHSRRIGEALAHDVWRSAVAGLEHRMGIAD